jgi:hypothetical protein
MTTVVDNSDISGISGITQPLEIQTNLIIESIPIQSQSTSSQHLGETGTSNARKDSRSKKRKSPAASVDSENEVQDDSVSVEAGAISVETSSPENELDSIQNAKQGSKARGKATRNSGKRRKTQTIKETQTVSGNSKGLKGPKHSSNSNTPKATQGLLVSRRRFHDPPVVGKGGLGGIFRKGNGEAEMVTSSTTEPSIYGVADRPCIVILFLDKIIKPDSCQDMSEMFLSLAEQLNIKLVISTTSSRRAAEKDMAFCVNLKARCIFVIGHSVERDVKVMQDKYLGTAELMMTRYCQNHLDGTESASTLLSFNKILALCGGVSDPDRRYVFLTCAESLKSYIGRNKGAKRRWEFAIEEKYHKQTVFSSEPILLVERVLTSLHEVVQNFLQFDCLPFRFWRYDNSVPVNSRMPPPTQMHSRGREATIDEQMMMSTGTHSKEEFVHQRLNLLPHPCQALCTNSFYLYNKLDLQQANICRDWFQTYHKTVILSKFGIALE